MPRVIQVGELRPHFSVTSDSLLAALPTRQTGRLAFHFWGWLKNSLLVNLPPTWSPSCSTARGVGLSAPRAPVASVLVHLLFLLEKHQQKREVILNSGQSGANGQRASARLHAGLPVRRGHGQGVPGSPHSDPALTSVPSLCRAPLPGVCLGRFSGGLPRKRHCLLRASPRDPQVAACCVSGDLYGGVACLLLAEWLFPL